MVLHKVLGASSRSNLDLILLSNTLCVYLAQSYLVFYDFRAATPVLTSPNPNPSKPYRSLAFDSQRSLLFAGEGACKQGEIHVFRINNITQQTTAAAVVTIELETVLRGHRYGVSAIALLKDVVMSIGDENDKGLILWEMCTPRMLGANMITKAKIRGVVALPFND